MARFQDEFILEPFNDEDIAAMIDVRVRRENQLGWRPHPRGSRNTLAPFLGTHGSCSGDEQAVHGPSAKRPAIIRALRAVDIHEPAMEGWQDGPGATGLELDMDDLEGAREQDAPPPVRPQLDDRVEPDSRWMEDFAPVEARAESPEVLEPSSVPTPVPEAAPPRVPVVSRVDPSSPFGRIARRSIDASNAQASEPVASPAVEEPESAAEETVGDAWEFTDNTVAPAPPEEQPPAPSPVGTEPLHATPSARPAFGQDVLQVLERALAEMSPTELHRWRAWLRPSRALVCRTQVPCTTAPPRSGTEGVECRASGGGRSGQSARSLAFRCPHARQVGGEACTSFSSVQRLAQRRDPRRCAARALKGVHAVRRCARSTSRLEPSRR